MSRNRTLGELLYDLRAETARSLEPAHGLADQERLKAMIRRAQKELYEEYAWPHLTIDDVKLMAAGQRYYDFPAEIDLERVEGAWRRWGTQYDYDPLPFGIDPGMYAQFNSDTGERGDPILAWDFYNNGGSTVQFEVWPMPASDNSSALKFRGTKRLRPLNNESDRCDLDDTPVILWATALLTPAKERDNAFARARKSIQMNRARQDKSESFVRGGRLQDCESMLSRSETRFAFVRQ